jgi:hypothetical protein
MTLAVLTTANAHESRNDIITVNGQGSIFKAPDILKFTIAVEERGAQSKQLNASVNQKTKQILIVLQDHSINKQDIQAMAVSLYPWYERERQSNIQKGFVFSRNINVTLRDFSTYPDILNDLFSLETTRIEGLRYEVEDQQSAYLAALTEAMTDARRRAKQLADELDIKIGNVTNVEETSTYNPSPQPSARSLSVFSDSAQYLPGLNEINASVTVSYKIKR